MILFYVYEVRYILILLRSTSVFYSIKQHNQTGLAVTELELPKFQLSFPVDTTLATPPLTVPGVVEEGKAVIDETRSITSSLAIIEPFTAPAIIPARIKRMKIDKQIVHF